MKKILPIVLTFLILTGTTGIQNNSSFAQTEINGQQTIHAPDRLIVKFNPGVPEITQASILSSHSASVLDHLPLLGIKIISVPEPALDAVKNALSNNHSVEYAEYDLGVPPTAIPNDPEYSNQWHLPKINAPDAYDVTLGDGFPIGILDSGIDMDHSDLQANIVHPYNGVTQTPGPVDHVNGCGHGTPVAGSAAALTNNANGVAGVGWDTEIIPIKITDDSASPESSTKCYGWSNGVLGGVEWAVSKGAKVVNLSYGFDGSSSHIRDAADLLRQNEGWLVISAGNDYGQVNKTDYPNIIFVSSTTSSDNLSGFSSFGDYVDISAPGSSIYTTKAGDTYGGTSGTSFAAPITASVLNLIYSVEPTLSSTESFEILKNTAVDLGTAGYDIQFGHGRVDAYAAVLAASNIEESTDPTPVNFKVAFIGDQGLGSRSELVLQTIANEGADMVIHSGDLDYAQNPDAWNSQINAFLGPAFPYFVSVGNHDIEVAGQWNGYQTHLQNRLDLIPDATCTGDLGVKSSCHYKGIFFILSGVGTLNTYSETDYVNHIQTELANDDSVWSICSWHKNQNAMQVGSKSNEVGWNAYEACKDGGAIIATAHEHSYERTKTLTNTQTQTIDPFWTEANDVRVDQGSTFAFVSGLGGQSIRNQDRCNPDDYPYGCSEWANIYTSDQGANHGALFCVFNVDGQEDRAYCYFKNIAGDVVDSFYVTSFMGTPNTTTPPNNAPTSSSDSVTTDKNIPIGIDLAASDPDGDLLAYSIVSTPQNGSISGTGPYLIYTPDLNFVGNDNFSFRTSDGEFDSSTATISITVNDDNLPPGTIEIRILSSSDDAEQRVSTGLMDLSSSDIEIGDDPGHNEDQLGGLRFLGVEVPQGATITSAYIELTTDEIDTSSTSVTIRAQDSDNPSTFTSTNFDIANRPMTTAFVDWNDIPPWNTIGQKHNTPDISPIIQEVVNRSGWISGNNMAFIIDGTGSRTSESYDGTTPEMAALLHIEFDTSVPNNPPVANDQNSATNEDTPIGITLNATDADGDPLTYNVLSNPTNGALSGTAPNLTYTPNSNFNGVDSFTFNANDGTEDSNSATISIVIVPINDAPVAQSDNYFVDEDSTLNQSSPGVLENDSDIEDDPFNAVLDSDVSNGSLTLNIDGSFVYTPDPNFNGADSFTYHPLDADPGNTVNVSITVNPQNDNPVAEDDSDSTFEDNPVTVDVLANDSDIDGDSLNVSGVTQGTSGSVVNNGDGIITYTPNAGFSGTDNFTYDISDGNGGSDTASVTIDVTENTEIHVGDLDISKSGKKRWTAEVTITIHDNGENPVSGVTVDGLWSGGSSGSDSCVTNSSGSCQTNMATKGSSLTFEVTNVSGSGVDYLGSNHDDDGDSDGTSITINSDGTIPGGNSAPTANDQNLSTDQDTPKQVTLTASDPDNDTLTYTVLIGPTSGTLSGNAPNLTYSPNAGFTGDDSFTFKVNDGTVDSNIATISISVNEPLPETAVHVESISDEFSSKGPWNTVSMTIFVNDLGDQPIGGVLVSGSWGGYASGNDSCTTNSSGVCTVSDRSKSNGEVIFTVNNLSGSNISYDSGNNFANPPTASVIVP